MTGHEGILKSLAPPIYWVLEFDVNVSDPTAPTFNLTGWRSGFPAYEIYVQDSNQINQPIYQWTPPASRDVLYLLWEETIPSNTLVIP